MKKNVKKLISFCLILVLGTILIIPNKAFASTYEQFTVKNSYLNINYSFSGYFTGHSNYASITINFNVDSYSNSSCTKITAQPQIYIGNTVVASGEPVFLNIGSTELVNHYSGATTYSGKAPYKIVVEVKFYDSYNQCINTITHEIGTIFI